jgi:hypothetical protein
MNLHKHTHALITLINEYCAASELGKKISVTHCVYDSKRKGDEICLELSSFRENDDFKIWRYVFHFGIIKEKCAESQELFYGLSEVIKGLASKVNINIPKMFIDIVIIEPAQLSKQEATA